MSTDVPTGGPPAEPTDPTAATDQTAGQPQPADTPVPATDVAGQVAPAPDTVGVDPAQSPQTDQTGGQITAPTGEPSAAPTGEGGVTADPGAADTADTLDAMAPEQDPNEATRQAAIEANAPPRGAPVPNAPDGGDYQGATDSVNLLQDPAADVVSSGSDTVLVDPTDPVLAAAVGRWLERQAARDARLSPVIERLQYLPGVRLEFAADDPIFLEARPAEPAAA